MEYDLHLFLDIILNEGVQFVRRDERDGVSMEIYQSYKGTAFIDMEEDTLPFETICDYLHQLGLDHLQNLIFPNLQNHQLTKDLPINDPAEMLKQIEENPEKF